MMDCLIFFLISEILMLFQKMTCVLSSEHESQIVAIIGTSLYDIHVGLNKKALLAFHSVCHVFFRDKTRRLWNKML